METFPLINQLFPSYLSKIWKIDIGGSKRLLIPSGKLRRRVTSIVNKVTIPILSTGPLDIERVYQEKIRSFQECWINLVEVYQQGNKKPKPEPSMNIAFYDRTLRMVKNDAIFASDTPLIRDTVQILKDYETTLHSVKISTVRMKLLEDALRLNEIDVNDFLNSLYGSYLALVCFWIIGRNNRHGERLIPFISKISRDLAINLDNYTETLDIVTNPEEMDLMKRAEQWERRGQRPIQKHSIQNKAQ
jgi:hypothetical protein